MTTSTPTRVFISYTHDSEMHQDRVLALSDLLRDEGVDCCLDQYEEQSPPEGWPQWMQREISNAAFVVIVCTPAYKRRFERSEPPDKGLGATWEGAVITNELYQNAGKNEKFLPVIFDAKDKSSIPALLQPATYYNLAADKGYDQLYRRITNQHDTPQAPLGSVRSLPKKARTTNF